MQLNQKHLREIHAVGRAAVAKADRTLRPDVDAFWPIYLSAAIAQAGAMSVTEVDSSQRTALINAIDVLEKLGYEGTVSDLRDLLVQKAILTAMETGKASAAWMQTALTVRSARVTTEADDPVERFLSDLRSELHRARAKFPGDRVMTIALAEEFGELCKAVLDEPAANVRKEAIQTAAMCARVVLDGDGAVTEWRAQKGLDPLVQPSPSPCPQCLGKGTVLFRDFQEAWDVPCGACQGEGAGA